MSEPAILARDLRYEARGRGIVAGVSLAVAAGEIFGVVGADGAGKSSLLRLLTGEWPASGGSVRVLGLAPGDTALRERIAYMPQTFGQYPDLTVRENLDFYAALQGLRGAEAVQRARQLLASTGLAGFEGRRAGQLSGGMMQKLALACALVSRPRAMFLDEPTTGVDPVSRRAFWQLLEGVRSEGVAIVYATANMAEAERCDRIAMMEQGRFVQEGRGADLVAAVRSRLFVATGAQVRALVPLLRARPEVELAFPMGRQVRVWLRPQADATALQGALGPSCSLAPRTPELEDVALRALATKEPARA